MAALPEVHQALLRSRPIAAEGLKFVVTHVIESGELRAAQCSASVQYPFHVDVEMDRWMPLLLAACNGRPTGMELYEIMRQQGHVPVEAQPEELGRYSPHSANRQPVPVYLLAQLRIANDDSTTITGWRNISIASGILRSKQAYDAGRTG